MLPVADLHCDLLSYLAENDKRDPLQREVRCSLPQLKEGNVFFQILAVFTQTGRGSAISAEKQCAIYSELPQTYQGACQKFTSLNCQTDKIQIGLAIENASGFVEEDEHLDICFERFEKYESMAGPFFYISLTWNEENRFGGGNASSNGLKREGEIFLDFLNGKKIAIDLSHSSDALAYDILDYCEKKSLDIIPLASHSNFRAICHNVRNLPDPIAGQIAKKGGLIGINFFKHFMGDTFLDAFKKQVEYAKTLCILDHLCFGADFFYDVDLSNSRYPRPFYHKHFEHAGCYPLLIDYMKDEFGEELAAKIAYKNVDSYIKRMGGGKCYL